MSHNVELKGTKITDLTALRQACDELSREGARATLDENAKQFRTYSGQDSRCDAAIIMGNGRHDIGLRKQADGSYQPVFDPYGFSRDFRIEEAAENFEPHGTRNYDEEAARNCIGKLIQRYNVCKVERESAMTGNTFTRAVGPKGIIELEITVS